MSQVLTHKWNLERNYENKTVITLPFVLKLGSKQQLVDNKKVKN